MRMRGVRYWWAGIGLLVLALMYASPVLATFRTPSLPGSTPPLPALSVPQIAFPQLQVPKVHRLASLPALPRTSPAAHAAPAARQAVSHRVPVISDKHRQAATPQSAQKKAKDPFANVAVVSDSVGSPLNLPAPPPAAATPATPPAAVPPTADTPATTDTATNDSSMGWFSASDEPSAPPADATTTPADDTSSAITSDATAAAPAAWTVSLSDASGHDATISADGTNLTVSVDGATQSKALADVTSLQLIGGSGDDAVTIDASALGLAFPISIDGAGGTDTLHGPAVDSAWSVNGAGSGSVQDIAFAGFENLNGAAGNHDTFGFGDGGSLSGVADGGAGGYDSVVFSGDTNSVAFNATGPQSGTIQHDGGVITYAGMEPLSVTSTATDITVTIPDGATDVVLDAVGADTRVSCSGCMESSAFANPTGNLTINLGSGGQSLTLNSPAAGFNANLVVNGGAGNDRLIFSAKAGSGLYSFDGGAGTDTVTGPNVQNTWAVTGIDSGFLASSFAGGLGGISFGNSESIDEGTSHDAIVFSADGSLTGTVTNHGGTVDLSIGGFAHFSGSLNFVVGTQDITLEDATHVTGAKYLAIGLSDADIFVGVNRGTANEVGIDKLIHAAGAVLFADTVSSKVYYAVKANAADFSISLNGGSSGHAVDFSGAGAFTVATPSSGNIVFDAAGPVADASVTGGHLSLLGGLLEGSADVAFHSALVDADLDGSGGIDPATGEHGAHLQTFAVTNASLTVGTAGYGVTFGGDVAVAELTPSGATDTRQWIGVSASGLTGSVALGSLAIAAVANGVVQINTATGAAPIDWATVTGSGLTLAGGLLSISGDLTNLMIGGFVHGSAHFAVTRSLVGVHLTSEDLTDAVLVTLALSNVQVTVGDPAGVDFVSTGGSLALASLHAPAATLPATDTRVWLTAKGTLSGVSFNGVTGLTLALTDLGLALNTATGAHDDGAGHSTPASALDWTSALDLNGNGTFGEPGVAPAGDQLAPGGTPLDLAIGMVQASGTGTVNVFDFVAGTVAFVFKQQTVDVDADSSGSIVPGIPSVHGARGPPDVFGATLSTLGLTATSMSIGITNGPRFTATGGTLALAVVTPSAADQLAGDGRYWVALKSDIATAELTGIDGFTAFGSDLTVELNQARGVYRPSAENIPADALNWNTGLSSGAVVIGSTTIDFATESFEAGGTLGLEIASGFVAASGTFRVTSVAIASGTFAGGHALKLTVSSASLFVGVGGSLDATDHHTVHPGAAGISATGVGLTVAALTSGLTTYTGLELTVGTADLLGIPGVTLHVSDLDIKVNDATGGTSPAAIDWTTVPELSFGLAEATTLDVSGTVGVDIGGFVSAAGSFTFARQSISTGTFSGSTAVKLVVSDASLFVGVGGSLSADFKSVNAGTAGISATGVDITLAAVGSPGTELEFAL